jgi:hypothetical protein
VGGGSHLIGRNVRVNSSMGPAVMLDDKASAYFKDCSFSCYNEELGLKNGPALLAKNDSLISMFGCTVELAKWAVYAGKDSAKLFKFNAAQDSVDEGIAQAYNGEEYEGQVVQPWPGGWSRQEPAG